MGFMADTTISVSKEFHDWLKDKGLKGESYEEIIKRLIKPEMLEEYKPKDVPQEQKPDSSEREEKGKPDIMDQIFGEEIK